MTQPDRPLRLDALAKRRSAAVRLVTEAWRSFDRFRPEDRRWTIACGGSSKRACPRARARFHETLDDAARILDESIAQASLATSRSRFERPRDRGPGRSGHTYYINLAVDARQLRSRDQAVRWVAEFIGFRPRVGAFTSGGTISNVSALAAARERRCRIPPHRARRASRRRLLLEGVPYSVMRAVELLAWAPTPARG